MCKPPRLILLLCGLGLACINNSYAADWQIKPQVDIVETYSDNISLASDAATASDDYITQLSPAISIIGNGNRLKFDSSYTLQNLFYANSSSQNKSHNQLRLKADTELIEDLFYLSVDSQVFQQLLAPGNGLVTDNINIGSGRGDVMTSHVQPRLKRTLGKEIEFDLSYTEGRVNYDSETITDVRLHDTKLILDRSNTSAKLDWQLSYNQSRQWGAGALTSEREQSAVMMSYATFENVSLIANGGKEDGQIISSKSYKSGTYWSVGLMWRLSPRLSVEAAKGDNDQQASLTWAPSARTTLSAKYIDREVGVHASNSWSGIFKHLTRRTLWALSYVEEITSDARLAIVGNQTVALTDKDGAPVFDDFGRLVVAQSYQLGIVDESYRRESGQANFTYSARKNDLSIGANSEQRYYELTNRQAQLHSGFIGWRLKLTARSTSDVKYSLNRSSGNSASADAETKTLMWALKRMLGKHITTGLELRATEVDGGTASLSRSENRISANVRVIF